MDTSVHNLCPILLRLLSVSYQTHSCLLAPSVNNNDKIQGIGKNPRYRQKGVFMVHGVCSCIIELEVDSLFCVVQLALSFIPVTVSHDLKYSYGGQTAKHEAVQFHAILNHSVAKNEVSMGRGATHSKMAPPQLHHGNAVCYIIHYRMGYLMVLK